MATRPTWQGYLRLSLVSCPVALYTATQRTSDVSFNMLHKQTNNRIRMIPTDPETGPVDRADIVKGYEVEKGHYVVVTGRGDQERPAGDHADPGYRAVRGRGRDRSPATGTTLIS